MKVSHSLILLLLCGFLVISITTLKDKSKSEKTVKPSRQPPPNTKQSGKNSKVPSNAKAQSKDKTSQPSKNKDKNGVPPKPPK